MRERAGTDRNSTNLKGLIQAAETVDLSAKAVKGEAGSLTSEVPVPCIAHVTKQQQFHFIVIYKISKKKVWVAGPDPIVGKTTYTHGEFSKIRTGYLVLMSRGENFRKKVESPGLFHRFLTVLKPHVGTIVNTIVASIVLTILGIAGAMYFRVLMDASITLGFLRHLFHRLWRFLTPGKLGKFSVVLVILSGSVNTILFKELLIQL